MQEFHRGNDIETTEIRRVSCIDEITHKLSIRIKGNEERKKKVYIDDPKKSSNI